MAEPGRRGISVLALGLALGVAADTLLRPTPWGVGAALTASGLVVAVFLLTPRPAAASGAGYALAALLLSAGFACRDAAVLKLLDAIGLAATLGLLASERDDRTAPSLSGHATRIVGSALHTLFGPPLLLVQDLPWRELQPARTVVAAARVVRGIGLALPTLAVFGLLLANADPVFAAELEQWLAVDVLAWASHACGVTLCAWLAIGFLRAAVLRERPARGPLPRPAGGALGGVEIALLLGSLDLLFAAFVWVQTKYLFGGAPWVKGAAGLTFAEYARQGFFELVAVVALVLPLLLVSDWLLEPGRAPARLFAALGGVQVLLVLAILASALERMRLYQAEYGLTQLRFYSTAFMAWIGLLLAWFSVTVLRGRREAFARGLVAAALLALALLNASDPDRRIVLANLRAPHGFDSGYALRLSADAVPALLDGLPRLTPESRHAVECGVAARWIDADPDWRTWSASRSRARRVVAQAGLRLGP